MFFTSMAHFDTATLLRCRLVSRGWRDAIDSHTELWNRMSLMRAIKDNRIDLCKLIVEYAGGKTQDMEDVDKQFQVIFENMANKSCEGMTPLHIAARNNNADICRIILKEVDVKNPGTLRPWNTEYSMIRPMIPQLMHGLTPLHLAAEHGAMDTCRLIIDVATSKNPAAAIVPRFCWTPLHYTARNGHLDICQLILDNVEEKNPGTDFLGNNGISLPGVEITPLSLANKYGHDDICKLILAAIYPDEDLSQLTFPTDAHRRLFNNYS